VLGVTASAGSASPLGNAWWIQQHVADLAPEEVAARATLPEFVEAMRYVQGSAQIVEPAR
jgi:hypothetical protein